MKKIISKVLGFFAGLFMVFALVGCNISEDYAEKINKAADAGERYTYAEVIDDLGDNYSGKLVLESGALTWYKGYDSYEEAKAAYDEGKTVKLIVVTFLGGEATGAAYDEWVKEEK